MPLVAVLLILAGVAIATTGLATRSAGATPVRPPQLNINIKRKVEEFRELAVDESEGLVHVRSPLVLAVIARETAGISRPGAAGEVGLMQVMRAAWQDYFAATNDPDAASFPADLESPRINIRVGAWFLDRKIQDMRGDLYHGLRAYNCGTRGARDNPGCGGAYAEWILNVGEPAFRAIT